MAGRLDASWLFFPYEQTVWKPEALRQTRKLDLGSPPPACLWNLQPQMIHMLAVSLSLSDMIHLA